MINPYVVAYTELGPELSDFDRRREIGIRQYNNDNPVFGREVAKGFAKHNCKRCYGNGVQYWDIPYRIKYLMACTCVQNKIEKLDKVERNAILGLSDE